MYWLQNTYSTESFPLCFNYMYLISKVFFSLIILPFKAARFPPHDAADMTKLLLEGLSETSMSPSIDKDIDGGIGEN